MILGFDAKNTLGICKTFCHEYFWELLDYKTTERMSEGWLSTVSFTNYDKPGFCEKFLFHVLMSDLSKTQPHSSLNPSFKFS